MHDKAQRRADAKAWERFLAACTPQIKAEAMRLIGEGGTRPEIMAKLGGSATFGQPFSRSPAMTKAIDKINARTAQTKRGARS